MNKRVMTDKEVERWYNDQRTDGHDCYIILQPEQIAEIRIKYGLVDKYYQTVDVFNQWLM